MTELDDASGPRYSLLYWTTFAYIVGFPNFVHFDVTGRTSNAINFSSITLIIETVLLGYIFVVALLLERRKILVRPVSASIALWSALFIELVVVSIFQPKSRLIPVTLSSYGLAFFRLLQWLIAFSLILATYSRTPRERATAMIVRMIGRICWLWIAMVWLILPIMPGQVYGGAEDNPDAVRRLGGQLIAPSNLASLATFAFFYAALFAPKGTRRWAACLLATVTIVMTGARAQQAAFLVAIALYALLLTRKAMVRWGFVGVLLMALLVGVPLSSKLGKYVSRGQSAQTLSTLDDRTRVWSAATEAIRARPLFGYGYSLGARAALRDHWRFSHWVPPHAHNELMEVMLDGGLVALLLLCWIYGRYMWMAVRDAGRGPFQIFFFLLTALFTMDLVSGGELGFNFRCSGGIFLLSYVGVVDGARKRREMEVSQSIKEAHRLREMVHAG